MAKIYDKRTNKEAILLKAVIAAVKGSFSSFLTAQECRNWIVRYGLKSFVGTHVHWNKQPEGEQYWSDVFDDIPANAMKKEIV